MLDRWLTALPVYNEANHVGPVLDEVTRYAHDVLVVDDGSTDTTAARLGDRDDIVVVRHETNRGYGAALRTAFAYALANNYDVIVTIDCDGQHEPKRIPQFAKAAKDTDVVSGSRYLRLFDDDVEAPQDRRKINQMITAELNEKLGLALTDAFCGFKAYRVSSLATLRLTEDGYAMPLEFWVQAALHGLRIRELPVPRVYLEEERSFGGSLDDPYQRFGHYRDIVQQSLENAGLGAGSDQSVLQEGTVRVKKLTRECA